ncbi:MAG TPA: bifunctional hydroxymethylpyrimidine kinase/phosphomethylpyrimidine kinase [Pyrinomonadaceae bacterium]|nr:bifunctional hydroxymethylpyrimidine kinase/phosphomethylpyrimidine kinase [Pyrinomonadaceae bacterium]
MPMNEVKVCMSIAGLDPSGGAGVVADVKTFTAFGCFATAAITSVTYQNTTGVFGATHLDAASIRGQIDAVMKDITVSAAKTGMIATKEGISATAEILREWQVPFLVVDPVVRSTSGYDLIDDAALRSLIDELFPISTLVTPNKQEAERIAGIEMRGDEQIEQAARTMISMGASNVLIKGGHFDGIDSQIAMARDLLFCGDGSVQIFEEERIDTAATHGTGCTLAAAITANLALGLDLAEAVRISKGFVTEAIRNGISVGRGNSPINIPRDASTIDKI